MPRRTRKAQEGTQASEARAYQDAYRQAREAGFTARDLTPAPTLDELRRMVAGKRATTSR